MSATGIQEVLPGTDFSAAGCGNAGWTDFQNLTQVKMVGSAIPALLINKKSKMIGTQTGGVPTEGAFYREFNASGMYQATGVIPSAGSRTIMTTFSTTSGDTSSSFLNFLGNSSGATPLAGVILAGESTFALSRAANSQIQHATLVGGSVIGLATTLTGVIDVPITAFVVIDTSVTMCTGSITGNILTVTVAPTKVLDGSASTINAGDIVSASKSTVIVAAGVTILPYGTGGTSGTGGTGTYQISATLGVALTSTTINTGTGPGRRLDLYAAGGKSASVTGAISSVPSAREFYFGVQPAVTNVTIARAHYPIVAWDGVHSRAQTALDYAYAQQFAAANGLAM
jgi:hypothetical protein